MPDASDFFRGYARDVGLNPTIGGADNVQDALAANTGIIVAPFTWSFVTLGPYAAVNGDGSTQPLNPGGGSGGGNVVVAVPVTTYAAGAFVYTFGLSVENLPDSASAWDMNIDVTVANVAGTEIIVVSGTTTIPAHTSTGDFDVTQLAKGSGTGADLTYDAGAHTIVSDAGGAYGVLFVVGMGYD